MDFYLDSLPMSPDIRTERNDDDDEFSLSKTPDVSNLNLPQIQLPPRFILVAWHHHRKRRSVGLANPTRGSP
jgi:hypothetical protein